MTSLIPTRGEIVRAVSRVYGFGDGSSLSAARQSIVDDCISAGIRRFCNPPPVEQGKPAHRWSFLEGTDTLETVADQEDYEMSAEFESLTSSVMHSRFGFAGPQIERTSVERILWLRAEGDLIESGLPCLVAQQASPGTTHAVKLLFWPTPDDAYTLTYEYRVAQETLVSDSADPMGGLPASTAIMNACLAEAELRIEGAEGPQARRWAESLAAAIHADYAADRITSSGSMRRDGRHGIGGEFRTGALGAPTITYPMDFP